MGQSPRLGLDFWKQFTGLEPGGKALEAGGLRALSPRRPPGDRVGVLAAGLEEALAPVEATPQLENSPPDPGLQSNSI